MSWDPIKVSELPLLDASVLQGRSVVVMPYWDGTQWHMWVPAPGGGLLPMRCGGVIAYDYVARVAEQPTDLYIPFVDFLWQRASWSHTAGSLNLVEDDVHNLGTCFAKFEHFHQHREQIGDGVGLFATTELEYLLVLVRSTVDLCYDLFRDLWNRNVRLGTELRQPQALPKKLSALVFDESPKGTRVRDANYLCTKHKLTESLAAALVEAGTFLLPIRQARDGIAHHGKQLRTIYPTERGFCINRHEQPYNLFNVWNNSHRYNESLVSITPLLAHLVVNAVNLCNVIAQGFAQQIKFPPEIAPGYHVFVRGFHNKALKRAVEIAQGASPWPDGHSDSAPPQITDMGEGSFNV